MGDCNWFMGYNRKIMGYIGMSMSYSRNIRLYKEIYGLY
ncbi:hypothetical protein SAMN05421832_10582 [Psychrobacillus psychrodurans]|nr:hypothetical protein SAMN05421832_10582 [Psychrobacillus psychrodurans]